MFGLSLEALAALRISGEVLGQDLDRHLAVQLGVLGGVDLSHAAGTQLVGDLVVVQLCSDHQENLEGAACFARDHGAVRIPFPPKDCPLNLLYSRLDR